MPERLFTPQSARRELDQVRPAAETMCRLFQALEQKRPARIVSDQKVDSAYFALLLRLHGVLEQIARRGVQVKDVQRGLLDFPARRDGRTVLLCWRVGEAGLAFWHEIEAGFAGRQPVDDDGPWEQA